MLWLACLVSDHKLSPLCRFDFKKWEGLHPVTNIILAIILDIKP